MLVSTNQMRFSTTLTRAGLWFSILALLCVFMVFPALAEEFIRAFDTDVELRRDGSVLVTENITVAAEGNKIRRGIFRDVPTVLVNDNGLRIRSGLEVLDIQRDGVSEPFNTQSIDNGTRIYIGDADVFLSIGTYRYTITYTLSRMARRFENYDELFWNATGNFWDFRIESATATLRLPDGAVVDDIAAYTGPFGSTASNVAITRRSDNEVQFRLTEPLNAYEGMSVAVSFQKGILNEVEGAEQVSNFLSDYRDVLVPAIAVLLVLAYYFSTWMSVGRDPRKGTIFPQFHAPEGFSPALTHYVWARGWRKSGWQAFTAAIINLAVKGLIDIGEKSKKTTLTVKPSGFEQDPKLPPGEAVIYNYLSAKQTLTINKTSGPKLMAKRVEFINALESENRQVYFLNNYKYVVFGVLLSVLCLVAMLVTGVLAFEWFLAAVVGGMAISTLVFVIKSLMSGSGIVKFLQIGVFVIFGFNFIVGIGSTIPLSSAISLPTPAIAAGSIVIINVIFAILMRAPTVQGRKIMDHIDGLRMYLETAEKNRLNFQDEPELTTERFERILPYAIALGVEKPWSEHFENELARISPSSETTRYQPSWYQSRTFSSSNFSKDMGAIATGMSAAMIAAQPASSSSSGSSGGGSSGGGGGGGGGGGW